MKQVRPYIVIDRYITEDYYFVLATSAKEAVSLVENSDLQEKGEYSTSVIKHYPYKAKPQKPPKQTAIQSDNPTKQQADPSLLKALNAIEKLEVDKFTEEQNNEVAKETQ